MCSQMPSQSRILSIADLSASADQSLGRAEILAASMRARLDILGISPDDQNRQERDIGENRIKKWLTGLHDKGISGEVSFVVAPAASKISRHIDRARPDLVIVSGVRSNKSDHVRLAVSEVLRRRLPSPTLIVKQDGNKPYRRILIATDLSENARQATQTFRHLKVAGQAEVQLYHAYPVPGLHLVMGHVLQDKGRDGYLAGERKDADSRLKAFGESVGYAESKRILTPITGRTSDAILEASRDHSIDLIIAGTHGRKGLAKVMLGSVAKVLVQEAECDVLAIPTPTYRAG